MAQRQQYAADIAVAQIAINEGNLARARSLLEGHIPGVGQEDMRDFVWHYLSARSKGGHNKEYLGHRHGVTALDIAENGNYLISSTSFGEVIVWDLIKEKILYRFEFGRTVFPRVAIISNASAFLVSSLIDGWARIFRLSDGELEFELDDVAGFLSSDKLSIPIRSDDESLPHSFNLITRSRGKPLGVGANWGQVLEEGRLVLSFSGASGGIYADEMLLQGVERAVKEVQLPNAFIFDAIKFHPQTKRLVVGKNGKIDVYDGRSMELTKSRQLLSENIVNSISVSESGDLIAASLWQPQLKVWNLETEEVCEIGPLESEVYSMSFHPNSKMLITGNKDGSIRSWPISFLKGNVGDGIQVASRDSSVFLDASRDFVVSDDGQTIAIASIDAVSKAPVIALHDTEEFALGQSLRTEGVPVVFRDRDSRLVSLSRETLSHWNLVNGSSEKIEIDPLLENPSRSIVSWDKQWVILPDGPNTVKIIDLKTGNLLWQFDGLDAPSIAVAISRDGSRLAFSRDFYTVDVYSLENPPRLLESIDAPAVNTLAFSADGLALIIGGIFALVHYDLLNHDSTRLQGHLNDTILSLDLSPDGAVLASGSVDNTIKLWNLETLRELASFRWDNSRHIVVQFSRNGKVLIGRQPPDIPMTWVRSWSAEIP